MTTKRLFDATWQKVSSEKRLTRDIAKRIYEDGKMASFKERYCGKKRPERFVFCQLKEGHPGSCQAVVYWEDEDDE